MPHPLLKQPILIIEDDPNTAALVETYLRREGFATLTASGGIRALELARTCKPGFVILDIMLPEVDGWEICRRLRRESEVPILILTAREEEIDRVLGLSLGADDYVVKPFSPRELVERVRAILRRTQAGRTEQKSELCQGRLCLDPEQHRVTLAGKTIDLTGAEFRLLQILLGTPGRVFSRGELLERLYDNGETVVEKVVDVHIGKLRQKLGDHAAEPEIIETVRGFGYRLKS
ncbi:DNA-binding response regulator [Geothermobacter hydrogeniphilus]|uniref:Phosphate regulon transcriptional regulatory protein PhoB n=1 Tax=Geothermobacter hydrogeniphilus TaxID=1969733 RepID=A0A2K2H6A9_9BACT|nr:response regulator transcription factor [Geothermobacter hydrogeniphilus]PNU18780.1 DNA-binding response regulator [Geothermobacter hydrogeniphilus]